MEFVFTAALAGLLATPHCAAMCGGFAAACARPRTGLSAWHAGRLLTYMTLGALAGGFGRLLPGPAWLPAIVSALFLMWFAASLAGFAPQPTARMPRLTQLGTAAARKPAWRWRLAFGAVNGLLPCGMVYAALSIAVATAHPWLGALAMFAFGAATLPGLTIIALGVRRLVIRDLRVRRILAAMIFVFGLWSIVVRAVELDAHTHDTTSTPAHVHHVQP